MNILYITNHLNIGGITSYVFSVASGMKKRGHRVYIASSGGMLLERFRREGINYIPIPIKTKKEISPKILISYFKLKKIIKDCEIDLVHTHSRTTQVLGCLLHRKTGVAFISTCHGFFKPRVLRRIFPCWGKKVIAISDEVRKHLICDFRVPEENIRVIHNGVDLTQLPTPNSQLPTEIRAKFGLGAGPIIGIVARLSDVKGHIYLIQAMQKVLLNEPGAQLLIVGEGKMKKELLELVQRLGVSQNIFFVPEVMDTKEVLSIMDVFVMPSLKEGLGLALIEAMAGGLAVIGSEVGGIKNLIQHGQNGLLAKPADSLGLAQAILELLANPEKRKSLGENARISIQERFSLEEMLLKTERLYSECVKAAG